MGKTITFTYDTNDFVRLKAKPEMVGRVRGFQYFAESEYLYVSFTKIDHRDDSGWIEARKLEKNPHWSEEDKEENKT